MVKLSGSMLGLWDWVLKGLVVVNFILLGFSLTSRILTCVNTRVYIEVSS
jgi:hypothetical protein